jgi:hypothetical protein
MDQGKSDQAEQKRSKPIGSTPPSNGDTPKPPTDQQLNSCQSSGTDPAS